MTTADTLHRYRHRFTGMGCPCEMRLHADHPRTAARAFALATAEVRRLDQKYSHYREDSGLARMLRAAARPQGTRVDSETAALLDFAGSLYTESGGRFDITAGRLSALWDRATSLPRTEAIEAALALTGWQRLGWDGSTLRLPTGMRLDLGGIVKEYAADRAALLLKSAGHHSGYVDLGGDLHVLGPHPDGSPWQIGIRHPRGPGAVATIAVPRGGLATSGDYERCSMIEGERYGHILDALTGWPAQGLASVSVIAPSCLLAGALSTLAMVQDRARGLELLESSGLTWWAHDGRFSFSGSDCMLQPRQRFPTREPERNPWHEHKDNWTPHFPHRDLQPVAGHSLPVSAAPGCRSRASGHHEPAPDCRQYF